MTKEIEGIYRLLCATTSSLLEELVDTQTILQILVNKNICNTNEVNEIRERVNRNSKKINEFRNIFAIYVSQTEEDLKFEELFKRSIKDPKSITPDEREYLLSVLHNSTK